MHDLLLGQPLGPAGTEADAWTAPRASARDDLRADVRSRDALHAIEADWRALAQRALEPNVFAEPDFLIPALRHLPGGERVQLLCLWRDIPGRRARLVGALPIVVERDLFGLREIRAWRPPLSSLGHPLIDADAPVPTLQALLSHLARHAPGVAGCVMSQVPADGPFATALAAAARRLGLQLFAFDRHERAVLRRAQADEGAAVRKRTLKELGRQRRRLEEAGPVRVERAVEPATVAQAVETFLGLEALGWKGRRGTALVQAAGAAELMRGTTQGFARRGACQVELLRVGERAIAGAILLRNGDRAWFWKVAYDEAFARYSPGVQLTMEMTRGLLQEGGFSMADSCAVQDHPMIDRLWLDRLGVADLVVSLRPHAPRAAWTVRTRQTLARRARSAAKQLHHRLTRTR